MASLLKKGGVKLELLTDYDMLLMVEKGIRGGIYHAMHRYAKANNKYMKNYDKKFDSSYLQYLDANNLYGLAMSEKLPVDAFEWLKNSSKLNEDFIKNYYKNSDKGYFLEVDVYLILIKIYHFYQKKKVEKIICRIEDREKYVVPIRALKQVLNCGLKLKKILRIIQFKQEAWLKPYIDMNT